MDRSGPDADQGVRIRRDPDASGREVRGVPADRRQERAECLSWLFWQMGSAPYLGGGFGHFYAYAPTKIEYAIDRYAMEVKRQLDVLDRRLADSEYLAGDDYSIADIAVWPWYGALAKGLLYGAGEFLACTNTRTCSAGPTPSPNARRSSAAAWSTAPGAIRPASCMSAMTPAISRPGRKTSLEMLPGHDDWRRRHAGMRESHWQRNIPIWRGLAVQDARKKRDGTRYRVRGAAAFAGTSRRSLPGSSKSWVAPG